MMTFVKVADRSEVPPGSLRRVAAEGLEVVLVNVDGTIHAVGAACTHDEAPLEEGELEDGCLRCPWHFSLFDLKTGAVIESPAADPIAVYEVKVADGAVYVAPPS